MKAFILLSLYIACLSVQGQNKAPKITAQNQTGSYGEQVCLDITTTDDNNDTVIIWWDKGILGVFTSNNQTVKFASASVCATLTRGKQNVGNNFFTVFASDGKDTTTKICNILVRDYPFNVHPVIVKKTHNTFEVDVKGDINEPWNNYIGLTYQSKIYDEANNLILTDTNKVSTFTAPTYQKYRLYTTYKTATPDAYGSVDTLYPDMNVGIILSSKLFYTYLAKKFALFIWFLKSREQAPKLFNPILKRFEEPVMSNLFSHKPPYPFHWV